MLYDFIKLENLSFPPFFNNITNAFNDVKERSKEIDI